MPDGLKNIKMATELFNTVVTYSQNEKLKRWLLLILNFWQPTPKRKLNRVSQQNEDKRKKRFFYAWKLARKYHEEAPVDLKNNHGDK